jgi:hypothetical protein
MTSNDLLPKLSRAAAALALPGQPGAFFSALQDAGARAIGHALFTVMRHDAEGGRNRRVHSSDPAAYPVSGYKPVKWDHPWTRRVLIEGTPWIGVGPADIAWAYPDHEKIAAMGLTTAMNLPVRWDGRTLGTVNLLRAATPFTAADATIGMVFAAFAVPALLTTDAA